MTPTNAATFRLRSRLATLGAAAAALALSGCVTAEREAYARHVNGAERPSLAMNHDLALAFGLDETEAPTEFADASSSSGFTE